MVVFLVKNKVVLWYNKIEIKNMLSIAQRAELQFKIDKIIKEIKEWF